MNGLRQLKLSDQRWRMFVNACPEATALHSPAWAELICECYGFKGFVLASVDEHGSIVAGLPVIEVESPLRRRPRWISLPFTDGCGPLSCGRESEALLLAGLEETREAAGVDRLEIRSNVAVPGGQHRTIAVRHTLVLELEEEAVLRRLDPSQVQRNIKRARREGVVVRRGEQESDLDRVFFALQVKTRRRLGVPVQPRRFYTLLWRRLIEPGHGFLLLAYAGETPIAGAVFLRANGTLTYKYGASSREHWRLRPNVLLFWTAIQMACASGAEVLDFGRTELEHQGLRAFKRNWGTREEPLTYTVLGRPERSQSRKLEPALGAIIRHAPPWVCQAVGASLYRFAP